MRNTLPDFDSDRGTSAAEAVSAIPLFERNLQLQLLFVDHKQLAVAYRPDTEHGRDRTFALSDRAVGGSGAKSEVEDLAALLDVFGDDHARPPRSSHHRP